jgi:type II secretory pathway component GspD/PulD (secretin)
MSPVFGISAVLAAALLLGVSTSPTPAAGPQANTSAVVPQVHVPGGEQKVTLRLRGLELPDALRLIGARAKLSFSVSPDVKGTADFDFYNESVNRILEIILAANNLQLRKVGNTYLVSTSPSAGLAGVKVFQLNYAGAAAMQTLLVGALTSAGITKPETQLIADARSNSILASGNEYFISQVSRLIQRLDQPQEHKIFRLNYIKAEEAGTLLSTSLFAGTSGAGVKFIPIVRENALMVVASPEDLRLVGDVIQQVDRRLRQVLVEVKLIELNGTSNNLLGVTFDGQTGVLSGNWDATTGLNLDYNPIQQALSQLRVRLNALLRENKARLLASPSIVAMDSKESRIEITDDIIERVQIETVQNASNTLVRQSVSLGTAGITLSITPKINPDGYISMKVEPTISFIRDTVRGSNNEIVATLKSQRRLLTPEVRVRDGETLIIGGLNQERTQDNVDKFPILGDLPLIGGVFRRTDKSTVTTELVVLLTPKVVPEGELIRNVERKPAK